MPTWPTMLPQKLDGSGYSESIQDNVLRTPMETGPDKVRLRFTAAVTRISGSIVVSASQLDAFRTFYETDVLYGSIPFDWVHPLTGAPVSFRFVTPPITQPEASGTHFRISLEIEVLP